MKILHLINYTGGGGTESYIYSLARKLHNDKCEFFIAYSIKGDSFDRFKDMGIKMIHLPMNSPYDIKAAKKLRNICKEHSIDVVHTHFLRENYISIISKFFGNKAKLINTRHMLDISSPKISLANRFMTRFNHSIIAVSKAVEDLLKKELGPKKNIELIYTGIDPEDWNLEKSDFRNEFKLDNDTILITSTARFSPEKGHKFLLDSIYHLKNNLKDIHGLPKFKFILVGNGKLLMDMIKYAKELNIFDDIIFTGYRRDIANILNDSDIFICMSEKEAFGISIMEALACKLPVITTDSGGTREIISNKETGIILKFGDIIALSEAILSLISNDELRDSYSRKGFNLIEERFSLDKTALQTYELYIK